MWPRNFPGLGKICVMWSFPGGTIFYQYMHVHHVWHVFLRWRFVFLFLDLCCFGPIGSVFFHRNGWRTILVRKIREEGIDITEFSTWGELLWTRPKASKSMYDVFYPTWMVDVLCFIKIPIYIPFNMNSKKGRITSNLTGKINTQKKWLIFVLV